MKNIDKDKEIRAYKLEEKLFIKFIKTFLNQSSNLGKNWLSDKTCKYKKKLGKSFTDDGRKNDQTMNTAAVRLRWQGSQRGQRPS